MQVAYNLDVIRSEYYRKPIKRLTMNFYMNEIWQKVKILTYELVHF